MLIHGSPLQSKYLCFPQAQKVKRPYDPFYGRDVKEASIECL